MSLYTLIGIACVHEEIREALFQNGPAALEKLGIRLTSPWEYAELNKWTQDKNKAAALRAALKAFHDGYCPVKPCPPPPPGWGCH